MKATLRAARPDDAEADDTTPEEKEAIVQAIKDARLWSTGEMIHELRRLEWQAAAWAFERLVTLAKRPVPPHTASDF